MGLSKTVSMDKETQRHQEQRRKQDTKNKISRAVVDACRPSQRIA